MGTCRGDWASVGMIFKPIMKELQSFGWNWLKLLGIVRTFEGIIIWIISLLYYKKVSRFMFHRT